MVFTFKEHSIWSQNSRWNLLDVPFEKLVFHTITNAFNLKIQRMPFFSFFIFFNFSCLLNLFQTSRVRNPASDCTPPNYVYVAPFFSHLNNRASASWWQQPFENVGTSRTKSIINKMFFSLLRCQVSWHIRLLVCTLCCCCGLLSDSWFGALQIKFSFFKFSIIYSGSRDHTDKEIPQFIKKNFP